MHCCHWTRSTVDFSSSRVGNLDCNSECPLKYRIRYQLENAQFMLSKASQERVFFVVYLKLPVNVVQCVCPICTSITFSFAGPQPVLYKAKMGFRFRSNVERYVFALVGMTRSGQEVVRVCTCGSDARIVRCCSHVMCLIWYLVYV